MSLVHRWNQVYLIITMETVGIMQDTNGQVEPWMSQFLL